MQVERWARPGRLNADLLQHWVCTSPESRVFDRVQRRKVHPREWELEVQSHIRTLRPLRLVDEAVMLGLIGNTVVSVAHFGRSVEGAVVVFAIASAQAFRGQGIGSQTLCRVLSVVRHPATGGRFGRGATFTRIDQRNDPSRALFKSHGFEFIGTDGAYEV